MLEDAAQIAALILLVIAAILLTFGDRLRWCRPGAFVLIAVALLLLLIAISGVADAEEGMASYYHEPQALACSNKQFDPDAMTAAHPSLPCGAKVRVRNKRNNKSVTLTINDRGPFIAGRIIDVSRRAAERLDMIGAGVVPVTVERIR